MHPSPPLSPKATGDAAARALPHGIVGQSYSSAAPRSGKKDAYPRAGHIVTSAFAEGAIEGSAALYEVPSPHATQYTFSRFDGAEAAAPMDELSAGGDASSSDGPEEGVVGEACEQM